MKEKYKVGQTVYYSLEDYDTGNPVIYSGKIESISIDKVLEYKGKTIKSKFYHLDNGIGVQENAMYTIEELFKMKEHLEHLLNTYQKKELLTIKEGD